jgi:hypothetical protein
LLSGFLAGLLAGVVMVGWNLFDFYFLHLTKTRLLDYLNILTSGLPPHGPGEVLFAQGLHLLWLGFLGVVFAYLVPFISSRNFLFRGWLYSIVVWILTDTFPVIFHVAHLEKTPFPTRLSAAIGATFWGLVLAWILERFAHRTTAADEV